MDPKEALKLALRALDDGKYDEAREHMTAYVHWRGVGGFEPEITIKGDQLHTLLTSACCAAEWRPENG